MQNLGKTGNGSFFAALTRVLACSLLASVLVAAVPLSMAGGISVGDFAVILAGRLQGAEGSQAVLTTDAAMGTLKRAGIHFRSSTSSPLTEGEVVDLFKQFGVSLQSENPASLMGRDRASALVGTFGASLVSKAGNPDALTLTAFSTRGSGAPGTPAAETIADCQSLPKTQDCQVCCRDLLSGSNATHVNRLCGKACNSKARNVSASEPTP